MLARRARVHQLFTASAMLGGCQHGKTTKNSRRAFFASLASPQRRT